jgi:hypothetical protein
LDGLQSLNGHARRRARNARQNRVVGSDSGGACVNRVAVIASASMRGVRRIAM